MEIVSILRNIFAFRLLPIAALTMVKAAIFIYVKKYIAYDKNKYMKVRLKGYGLSRSIFVGAEQLSLEESAKVLGIKIERFDWGYSGTAPSHTALALLLQVFGKEVATTWYKELAFEMVQFMPVGNFDIMYDFGKWYKDKTTNKLRHWSTYMKINISATSSSVWVHSIVDFSAAKFSTGVFKKGTLEYRELDALTAEHRATLKEYLHTLTSRKSVKTKKNIHTSIVFDDLQEVFFVANGMGTGYSYGTKFEI